MVFVWVGAFFAFLFGSMVISALAGAAAARVSRMLILWVPLTLVTCLLFESVYVSGLNLVRCLFLVEEGGSPFWDRYWIVLSNEWDIALKFGLLLGVVGWFWCLKRAGEFTRARLANAATQGNMN
jgi:hypothetical protein